MFINNISYNQGFIGKERDLESNLADHTSALLSASRVQKYDYMTG